VRVSSSSARVSSFRKVPAWNCLGFNVDTFGPHLDRCSGRLGRGDGRVGDRQGIWMR
jgi:hypothetical protein